MSLFTVHRWIVWRGQDSCAWVRFHRRLAGKLGPTIQSCTQVHQTCSRIIIGCRQGTGTQQHADKKGSSCRLSKDSSLRLSGFAGSVLYDWTPKAQHYFVKDIHIPSKIRVQFLPRKSTLNQVLSSSLQSSFLVSFQVSFCYALLKSRWLYQGPLL